MKKIIFKQLACILCICMLTSSIIAGAAVDFDQIDDLFTEQKEHYINNTYEIERQVNQPGSIPPASVGDDIEEGAGFTARTDGQWVVDTNQWKWKWQYADGSYAVDCWIVTNMKWYHFDSSGHMQEGWFLDIDNKWYYLLPGDGYMVVEWLYLGGDWFYLAPHAVESSWLEVNEKWYYFNWGGYMHTGWLLDEGKHYFLDRQDGYRRVSWLYDQGKWYYLNADGVLQHGWLALDGKTYYLDTTNGMMACDEWLAVHDSNYQTTFEHKFNGSGHLIESPGYRSITYGFNYGTDDINTISSANAVHMSLIRLGFLSTSATNVDSEHTIQPHDTGLRHRLNSGVFAVFGHAAPGMMAFTKGPDISRTYLTATLAGNPNWISMNGFSMTNTKLAYYSGSRSAVTDSNGGNLLTTSIDNGALTAFGFEDYVSALSMDLFAGNFFGFLEKGYTVTEAALDAAMALPDYDEAHAFVIAGDPDLRLSFDETRARSYILADIEAGEYVLKDEYENHLVFAKMVDGVEISDYYISDLDGNILSVRNRFSEADLVQAAELINGLATSSNATPVYDNDEQLAEILADELADKAITGYVISETSHIDIIEKISGKVYYLRIFNTVYTDAEGISYLEKTAVNLMNGKTIPYQDILREYSVK